MTSRYVHLGFEVGGDPGHSIPVVIPIRHMAVTGQTQESGKTTALEALITRSGLPAIAFLTKRGEASLNGRQILPYFEDRADWQFVQSILESTMKEKMKFERAWIVRACRGEETLAGVWRRVIKLQEGAKNSLSQDIYMLLGEYLKKVVPLIASLPKIDHVDLSAGLSVMDLVRYPQELQMLVISSTLDWIHKNSSGVISIIPEAWKFVPQGKNAPVKVVAENLIREGAGLRNYLWIDSQDMAAVDKMLLRACAVWLIGVQREANEIKRALSNMPAGLKKPRAEAVATLELGQFYACFGNEIRKTYVQPAWMDETAGKSIASGRLSVHDVQPPHTTKAKQPEQAAGTGRGESPAGSLRTGADSPVRAEKVASQTFAQEQEQEEDEMWKEKFEESERQRLELQRQFDEFRRSIHLNSYTPADPPASSSRPSSSRTENRPQPALGADTPLGEIVAAAVAQIRRDPVLVKLSQEQPSIEVRVNRTVVSMDDSTIKGKLAGLIHGRWFNGGRSFQEVRSELVRRGMEGKTANANLSNALKAFVEMGFLFNTGDGYELAPGAETRVVSA